MITPYEIPPLPEPEGTILKNHLKQVSYWNLHSHYILVNSVERQTNR
nr:unnamed protein product [Callosobruchus analis]